MHMTNGAISLANVSPTAKKGALSHVLCAFALEPKNTRGQDPIERT